MLIGYALTANFLWGKWANFLSWRAVLALASEGLRARRIARVFLILKSKGLYFFPLKLSCNLAFCVWLITVKTRAIDLRTTLLYFLKNHGLIEYFLGLVAFKKRDMKEKERKIDVYNSNTISNLYNFFFEL